MQLDLPVICGYNGPRLADRRCNTVHGQVDHMEGKGTIAMTNTPTDDQPGFMAEKPEHCFACYRLISPGQTYYLTLEHGVLCADCALDDALIEGA